MLQTTVLLWVSCLVTISPLAYSMTPEQKAKIHEHFESVGMECMKDHAITEDDINALRSSKIPTGESAPCFMACMLKKLGTMDDQGMLQKENTLELAKKVFEDEEELKNISDFLHSCAHVNSEPVSDGAKGCERAMIAFKCMTENASKFELEL